MSCTSLTEINLPVGLTTLGYEVFSDTSILYLEIPPTVTNLNPSFFCSIYNTKITPEFNNPNRAPDADTTSEVYVVSTESTSPLDGEVLPLKNIHLNAEKGLSVYIKYEITPDIDLDGGQMDGRKTFPAWSTAENLSEYLSTPTKTGYIFDSWEVVEAKTVNKNDLDYLVGPAESSQQLKLKAVWKSTILSKTRYIKILFLVLIMLYLLKLYLSKRNTNKSIHK